jgi:hypothetical protein
LQVTCQSKSVLYLSLIHNSIRAHIMIRIFEILFKILPTKS